MTLQDPNIPFAKTKDNATFEIKRINLNTLPPFYLKEQQELITSNIEGMKNLLK